MANTPRAGVNANGSVPLADTGSGAAGTLLGTERSKLQGILAGASRLATTALDGLMSAADKLLLDKLGVYRYASSGSNTNMTQNVDYTLASIALPDAGVYHIEGQVNFYAVSGAVACYGQLAFGGVPFAVGSVSVASTYDAPLSIRGQLTAGAGGNVTLVVSCNLTGTQYRGTDSLGRSPMITLMARKVG